MVLRKKAYKRLNYKPVIAFDIETCNNNKDFLLCCIKAPFGEFTLYSKEDVKKFFMNKKVRGHNVFATNIAFDFLGIFFKDTHLYQPQIRNRVIYGFTLHQQIEGKRRNPVQFLDTEHLIQGGVKNLGKLLGMPKLDNEDFIGKRPKTKKDWETLETYCKRDTDITYRAMTEIFIPFIKSKGIPLKKTIASSALTLFTEEYMQGQTWFNHPRDIQEFTREGYYGGITMNVKRGLVEETTQYDINSLYPFAMTKPLPDPNRYSEYEEGTLYNIMHKMGCSQVRVQCPKDMKIPILPKRVDGKLLLPAGTFEGVYNHNELAYAIEQGYSVLWIKKQLVFHKETTLLREYVEDLYADRLKYKENGSSFEKVCKLFLNSLYGKFAFNPNNATQIISEHQFDADKHAKLNPVPLLGGKFYSLEDKNPEKVPDYVFPIISSYITSHARLHMHKFLQNKALQPYIIYMDTDSIHLCYDAGLIKESSELGAMKKEYSAKNKIYVSPKMYETDNGFKCKGIQIKDKAMFDDLLLGKKVAQQRFVKFITAIRSKEHHKWGLLEPNQIIEIEKQTSLEDTKRVWQKPFNKTELQDSTPIILE